MRIAVVGGGTAGPAAALFLHGAGHEVTLFERVPDPMPVGAGLLLQPTGLKVLERLGLLGAVRSRGAVVDRLRGETAGGRVVMDLAYDALAPGLFGLGVQRGTLFGALFQAVLDAGLPVRLGVEVTGLRAGELVDVAGRRHGRFDLVVAADGARSQLRAAVAPHLVRRARRYPWGALWAIEDDLDGAFAGVLAQVYRGTREMVGFLPSGAGRVSLFWSIHEDEVAGWRAGGLDAWKARVLALAPRARPLLDQVTDLEEVVYAAYHDVVLSSPYCGNAVFIGDAGHAMSPQLGQGANLALVDAQVLAECLALHCDAGAALREFERRRAAHIRYYSWASRLLTPLFQSRLGFLGPPRDALLHPMARVPWMGRQFLSSLAGAKTSPLRTAVPPPV